MVLIHLDAVHFILVLDASWVGDLNAALSTQFTHQLARARWPLGEQGP